MARHPSSLNAKAIDISRERGGDALAIEAALSRIAVAFQVDASVARPDALDNYPFTLLTDAIEATSVESALMVIQSTDPLKIPTRSWMLRQVFAERSPFYSCNQLATRIETFIAFLKQNRHFIVQHGLPPHVFRRSRWLYVELGRLYDVKVAGSPGPADEYWSRAQRRKYPGQPPYTWQRRVKRIVTVGKALDGHAAEIEFSDLTSDLEFDDPPHAMDVDRPLAEIELGGFAECTYDEASLLCGLEHQDGIKLESLRPKLFDLKIALLEIGAAALRKNDNQTLWRDCSKRIAETLLADEVDFLLKMDAYYVGPATIVLGAEQSLAELIPGGMTDMYRFIGHCEKELGIGTFARTAKSLSKVIRSPRARRLLQEAEGSHSQYFILAARFGVDIVDAATDNFVELTRAEEGFWIDYQQRVNESIANDFDTVVETRQRIKRPFAEKFKTQVSMFAQLAADNLMTGNTLQIVLPDRSTKVNADGFVFIRQPNKLWMVGDGCGTKPIAHLVGMQYLAILLSNPGKKFLATDLSKLINLPPGGEFELQDGTLKVRAYERGIPVIDADSLEFYAAEILKLERNIEDALEKNDAEQLASARLRREQIRSEVKSSTGKNGKIRERGGQDDRARKAVTKAIDAAKIAIHSVHSALGSHLFATIKTGSSCSYDPEPIPPWIFE